MSASLSLEFVDTNILVYAYDKTAGTKHQRAAALLADLWQSRRGCISVQVLQEFYVVGTRKLPSRRASDLRAIMRDLSEWHLHKPTANDVLDAAELQEQMQVSFWDAMILHSATTLGCRIIWSEDLNPGQQYGAVRLLNPFQVGNNLHRSGENPH